MGRFIIRRLIAMVFVMFAVSVLTFLIFNVIPNGDPAARYSYSHSRNMRDERSSQRDRQSFALSTTLASCRPPHLEEGPSLQHLQESRSVTQG